MSTAIVPYIIGNWKMNGLAAQLNEISELYQGLSEADLLNSKTVICPPSTLIRPACANGKDKIAIGGQDCHWEEKGAHTGEISAQMLKDAGAQYVIVGHSERRADCFETNEQVKAKAGAALKADIIPIICVGETSLERESGKAIDIVLTQIKNSIPDNIDNNDIIVAYEPVWAIGTGLVPSIYDIDEMHNAIRASLVKKFAQNGKKTPILYGGSMKPTNAKQILEIENVNGGLVGGASLKASDFIQIIRACA